jgi:hypothetical protein
LSVSVGVTTLQHIAHACRANISSWAVVFAPMSQDVPSQSERRFGLSFSPFMAALTTPLLAGPRRCHVVVTDDRLAVVMGAGGWAFSATVPRSSITQVNRATGPVWSWGAHGWQGRWLVNGSSRGLVQITIQPSGRGACLGFPIKLRQLTVSLDEPDEFVAAVTQPCA